MTQAATVVRRQIIVRAPIERAFTVFTDRFGDFKPREYEMLGVPIAETEVEVEVTFTAEAPDRTQVDLEHRNLDRRGTGWESVRDGVEHDEGWPLYIGRYAALSGEDH